MRRSSAAGKTFRGLPSLSLLFALVLLILTPLTATAATLIAVSSNADYNLGTPPANGDGTGCTPRKALQNAADGARTFTDCAAGQQWGQSFFSRPRLMADSRTRSAPGAALIPIPPTPRPFSTRARTTAHERLS